MTNISKENEFSSNKLLNGSEIQYYQNISITNSNSNSQEYKSIAYPQKNSDKIKKKSTSKLIRPELDFLKIAKIKMKNLKEIVTTKFDKSFKELNNSIKNKKLLLTIDILKSIEDIRWKLIEEINDLEILSKDYEKKFNNILNQKTTQRNHSQLNNTNTSSFSNQNKRNSFSDNILPISPINDINNKKIISSIIHLNKTPNLKDSKKKSRIPYMNRSKSGTKIFNKSINNKSYGEIKINTITNSKKASNIHDYIKNVNSLNTSGNNNSNIDESYYETNINNYYKNKIEEKEKELSIIKEKLENEKVINKNLLNELDEVKYNKSVQKTKDKFNQIINKTNSNTRTDELLILSNKLTKLIEMVINFSYSMATLRSVIFSKEKMKKNESVQTYESLNNNLKQIYNEFESISKNLKDEIKINESKNKSLNQSKRNINSLNNSHDNKIIYKNDKNKIKNKIVNSINFSLISQESSHIYEKKQNLENLKIYNSNSSHNNKYKDININSPIKEENSLDITNEEKINIEEIKKNLSDYTINNMNANNIYKQLNVIQNKNRHGLNENYEIDLEKNKRASPNFPLHTNSEKVFTFRNNSSVSNKEGDKLTDKSGGNSEMGKPLPIDINKIIEENNNLKMQLASEKLKNNNIFNAEKSESHNDEEYEEIISGLKKKIEDKDKKINELQKMIDSDNLSDNSFKNKSKDKMNNSIVEIEKIKGNYQENISTIQDLYENMLIEKENKIKELSNEVNIIEKELEDLNDKYDKEKENVKLKNIKINGLENEKISLLEQINTFKIKEQDHEKNMELLKNENKKIKVELNNRNIDTNLNINDMKNYISNYQNDNINDNNFNSASNRQINKQKEELRLLKKKFKEILDDNNKLTNEVKDYNLNQIKEKEEFTEMIRNTFTKFLKASKIDNKNKDYAIIVLKLLGYDENDIKDIFKTQKKGTIFGMFQ